MRGCSHPSVTANSRAASRDANVVFDLNTRRQLPSPSERRTEQELRERLQSVVCVVGETTYLPVEKAWLEIVFNQNRR